MVGTFYTLKIFTKVVPSISYLVELNVILCSTYFQNQLDPVNFQAIFSNIPLVEFHISESFELVSAYDVVEINSHILALPVKKKHFLTRTFGTFFIVLVSM